MTQSHADWASDFFGTLNEMPDEPVSGIDQILEAMGTLPAFQSARQWMLKNLGVKRGGAILEGGSGGGAALADVLAVVGTEGRIRGIDPTKLFVEHARKRAAGAPNATYEVGDIRALPEKDGAFDGAFCDKVLIHAGPAHSALGELARVVRKGGAVGACEWLPYFAISTTKPELLDAFNAVFRKALHDYFVSANLARHFHAVGLSNVRTHAVLAHTDKLDGHPFWRAFIVHQMPMFVHAGLIEQPVADAFLADIEALNRKGEFSASFVVQAAVGTKA